MLKAEYGSTVSHLEAKHISSLSVPLIPDRDRFHRKILQAAKLRDDANEVLDRCQTELHDLLGIAPFTEDDVQYLGHGTDPQAFEVSSNETGDRLDATHHIPLARSAIAKLEGGRFPLVSLGRRVRSVYMPPRMARIYVQPSFGVPMLQGSQMPLIRPYGLKYISRTQTGGLNRWILEAGTILLTRSGTVGRVGIATKSQDGWAASEHLIRVLPQEGVSHPGWIATFLECTYGQHQLKSKIYGGVVDELTDFDTAQTLIPDVPYAAQAVIGDAAMSAYETKDAASALEEEAISELDQAIRGSIRTPTSLGVATDVGFD